MELEKMNVEVLEGCRATTGMSAMDYVAAFGISRGAIPKNASGGTILDVTPKGLPMVRVYAMARDGKFLIGIRRDFETLGLQYGRFCDALDKTANKRITG